MPPGQPLLFRLSTECTLQSPGNNCMACCISGLAELYNTRSLQLYIVCSMSLWVGCQATPTVSDAPVGQS
jgi:hypothetical protein